MPRRADGLGVPGLGKLPRVDLNPPGGGIEKSIDNVSPEGGTEKGPFLFAYALRASNTHITEARWGSMPGLSGNSGAQGGFALGPVSSAPGGNSRTIELFNASRRPSSSLR